MESRPGITAILRARARTRQQGRYTGKKENATKNGHQHDTNATRYIYFQMFTFSHKVNKQNTTQYKAKKPDNQKTHRNAPRQRDNHSPAQTPPRSHKARHSPRNTAQPPRLLAGRYKKPVCAAFYTPALDTKKRDR